MKPLSSSYPGNADARDAVERIYFARGVLEILKGTGLFNALIDRAMEDLDQVVRDVQSAPSEKSF